MEKPTVSIIIPTYNSENTLQDCLESIKNQTYPFCEIIIVDNLSSDDTLEIAKEYGARILCQRCNPAVGRNIGLVNSTGRYILLLDSDQTLSPSVIEECVQKCEDKKVGMVGIPEVFMGKGFWSNCSAVWKNCFEKVDRLYATSGSTVHGEARFFAKEHLVDAGMFDPALLWGENYDLCERLRKKGVSEDSCESRLCHYESTSVRKLLIKSLYYGRSMPVFVQQTSKQILPTVLKHASLAFKEVVRSCKKSPSVIFGVAFLLYIKTCYTILGLLIGLGTRQS